MFNEVSEMMGFLLGPETRKRLGCAPSLDVYENRDGSASRWTRA